MLEQLIAFRDLLMVVVPQFGKHYSMELQIYAKVYLTSVLFRVMSGDHIYWRWSNDRSIGHSL